ncbi:MAG: hypothetical protein WCI74_00750, partial [Actinomycetes bacterium]
MSKGRPRGESARYFRLAAIPLVVCGAIVVPLDAAAAGTPTPDPTPTAVLSAGAVPTINIGANTGDVTLTANGGTTLPVVVDVYDASGWDKVSTVTVCLYEDGGDA